MRPQSAKAKGRKLQQQVRQKLIDELGIHPEDLDSRPMGSQGEDIMMSNAARALFPFSTECKNQEKLNVFSAYDQAEENCPDHSDPVLIFKRNRTPIFAMIKFDCLLKMQKTINFSKNSD